MSKTLLILDHAPETCQECRLCMHITNFGMYCPALHEEVLMDTHQNCPLKGWPPNGLNRIPDSFEDTEYSKAFKEGWNSAITVLETWEGIFGEKNEESEGT